jgi:hypothetical protein
VHTLYATDGQGSAMAAGELLAPLADPSNVYVTVLHVDNYGNEIVADRVAEEALGWSLQHLSGAAVDVQLKRARPREARHPAELDEG